MFSVGVCIVALIVVSISHWVYKWRNPKCNGKLPPGSMGWPLIGETLQFLSSSNTFDVAPFIKKRKERYGSIFRTSLFGVRVIVSSDAELTYMMLEQKNKSIAGWYPQSMRKVTGSLSTEFMHGTSSKYFRNMMLTVIGPQSIKRTMAEIESVAIRNMKRWASQESVELKTAISDMIFELMGKKLISYDPEKSSESLREHYDNFSKGLISIPLEIPGTPFYKCLQGRKKILMMLKNMLEERRANPNKEQNDFFDYVIEAHKQNDTFLTEEIALELIFGLMLSNFETTFLTTTMALKFLTENPRALKELTEEHDKILSKRENPEAELTWEEYKSMTFTLQVIYETLRLANVSPVTFRQALHDIEYKGYTIPAGWVLMACPPAAHLDPNNYKDPLTFNPWRWEGVEMKGPTKNFMPFGAGLRYCIGSDFAKLQISVNLHCLVTKYRWKLIKGGDIVRTPFIQLPNGFHVQVFEREN